MTLAQIQYILYPAGKDQSVAAHQELVSLHGADDLAVKAYNLYQLTTVYFYQACFLYCQSYKMSRISCVNTCCF